MSENTWDKVEAAIVDEDQHAAARRDFVAAFGRAIRQERSRRNWTAEEAASRAGISSKTWLRLEDGKPVRGLTLSKVDEVFGLPPGAAMACWQDTKDVVPYLDKAYQAFQQKVQPTSANPLRSAKETNLHERIRDLDIPELKRLRDMINGAISTLEISMSKQLAESVHDLEKVSKDVIQALERASQSSTDLELLPESADPQERSHLQRKTVLEQRELSHALHMQYQAQERYRELLTRAQDLRHRIED